MSGYFDSLNRRLRDVSVIAVQEEVAPALPLPARLKPRPLPAGYTVLRERLLTLGNGKPLKTLVFAGCGGGEGCTQVVREFAEMLASSGLNVLRIDADARQGVSQGPGGADVGHLLDVGRELPASEVGQGLLTVLPSPTSMPDKERFYRAPEFVTWLEAQAEAYDYVLVDAPPLLRFADATLLGRLSDGLIIVAESEGTNRESLTRARTQLERAEVNILGVVLNRTRDPLPPILKPYLAFLNT